MLFAISGCLGGKDSQSPFLPPEPAAFGEGLPLRFEEVGVAAQACGSIIGVAPLGGVCFEPSVVETNSRLLVTNGNGGDVWASSNGGTDWQQFPAPTSTSRPQQVNPGGDALLTPDPANAARAWMTALRPNNVFLARSDDGGLTWPVAIEIPMGTPVDRQWLTFGPGRMMVHTQPGSEGDGIRAAVSTDGGSSWGPATEVAAGNISGPAAILGSRLVIPRHDYGASGSFVAVALSDDDGRTWRDVEVSRLTGTMFPAMVATGDSLHLAWLSFQGDIVWSTSTDGGETWSAPVALEDSGLAATCAPFVLAEDGGFAVAYFTHAKSGVDLQVLRVHGGLRSQATVAHVDTMPGQEKRPANTDHAYLSHGLDGKLLTTYVDGQGRMIVARET
jgi:hypothetical protein